MQTDYYSEFIPADINDSEIYEIEPKTQKSATCLTEESNIGDCANIIEEDNKGKLPILNLDFERKIKDRILFTKTKRKGEDNKALRFKLLENELRSLMSDIEDNTQENNIQLKQQVESFIEEVEIFKMKQNDDTFVNYWSHKLDELKIDSSNELPRNDSPNEISRNESRLMKSDTRISEFVEIEKRVALLEKQLGISGNFSESNLHDTIEDLKLKINIILDGGKSIEHIRSEMEQLNKNCQLYMENSKKIKNKSELLPLTDKKLSLLYSKIKQLPELENALNVITARLKSLDEIILHTAHNVDFISGLNTELRRIDNKLDSWEQSLSNLELQLDNDRKAFFEFKKD